MADAVEPNEWPRELTKPSEQVAAPDFRCLDELEYLLYLQGIIKVTFPPQPKRPQIPIWWIWTPSTLKAHLHRRESLARSPWIGNMFWGLNPTMQLGARN